MLKKKVSAEDQHLYNDRILFLLSGHCSVWETFGYAAKCQEEQKKEKTKVHSKVFFVFTNTEH